MSSKYIEQELRFRHVDVQIPHQYAIVEVDDTVELTRKFAGRKINLHRNMENVTFNDELTFAARIPANFEHNRASPFFVVTLKYD